MAESTTQHFAGKIAVGLCQVVDRPISSSVAGKVAISPSDDGAARPKALTSNQSIHMKNRIVLAVLWLTLATCLPIRCVAAVAVRPNFIVILADDQGWGTTSVLIDPLVPESKSDFFTTPNIERLAATGMRFAQAYASHCNCSPNHQAASNSGGANHNQANLGSVINQESFVIRHRLLIELAFENIYRHIVRLLSARSTAAVRNISFQQLDQVRYGLWVRTFKVGLFADIFVDVVKLKGRQTSFEGGLVAGCSPTTGAGT